MEKILITGVAGFIGSNLAQYLLQDENIEIYGIDNFTSSSMSNLYPLLKNDRFHFEEWDLKNEIPFTFEKAYHLAGCGDLRRYFENKTEYCLEKVELVKNLINSTIQNGAKLITTTFYQDKEKQDKDLHLLYDTQNFIDSLLIELISKNKINANLARLDYVYGENMSYGDNRYIIKSIINSLQDIDISDDFEECRYYTYIGDVIKNLALVMNNFIQEEIVDIINKNLYLKSDIVKLILKCAKSGSNYIQNGVFDYIKPNYSPKILTLDNNEQISCDTTVLEGISKTVSFMKLMYFS